MWLIVASLACLDIRISNTIGGIAPPPPLRVVWVLLCEVSAGAVEL